MAEFEVSDTTSVVRQTNISEQKGLGNTNQQVNLNVDIINLVPKEKVGKNEDTLEQTKKTQTKKTKTNKTAKSTPTKVIQTPVPVPVPVTTVNKNSGNHVDHVGGNYVVGEGNAVGGANSTNVSGVGNNTNVNSPEKEQEPAPPEPPVIPNPEPEPEKPKVAKEDEIAGKSWAKKLHAETNSRFANNATVEQVFRNINERNAYSFFKEYTRLAKNDSNPHTNGTMHDTFDITDLLNRISLNDAIPAMQALLDQAKEIGLEGSPEYDDLQTQIDLANEKNDRSYRPNGADPNKAEAKKYDSVIVNLLAKMNEIYQ